MTKVTVVMPAYNASSTIRASLESVFSQTLPPSEVLILDDGSTDETATVASSFVPRVQIIPGRHEGAAVARNLLCAAAQGDFVAFLDSDDVWHPDYLRVQCEKFREYPAAAAYFTGHVDFYDDALPVWPGEQDLSIEYIEAIEFLRRYNQTPGFFNMSFCCVPRRTLEQMGPEPFRLSPAEDWYFFNKISTCGSVVYYHASLAAYRVRVGSLSSNRLALSTALVSACEMLEQQFSAVPDRRFAEIFADAHSEKRRLLAKICLFQGKIADARVQLERALATGRGVRSQLKTLLLLWSTHLPQRLQPDWLAKHPRWKGIYRA
jgi:glycosyltransferase involved in cell wall biosynthesis